MEDFNNNNFLESKEERKIKGEKEQQAEEFLKSLEDRNKQTKSKTISFKCSLENYTMIRAKAILKGVSISDFLIDIASKEKVKGYEEAKENFNRKVRE